MRKVNLRNVDPAIDDPDASTWCKYSSFSSLISLSSPLQPIPPSTVTLLQKSSLILSVVFLPAFPSLANVIFMTSNPSLLHAPLSPWVLSLLPVLPPLPISKWPPLRSTAAQEVYPPQALSPPSISPVQMAGGTLPTPVLPFPHWPFPQILPTYHILLPIIPPISTPQ